MGTQPTIDDLTNWHVQLTEELHAAQLELSNSQKRIGEVQDRIRLIEQLIKLEGAEISSPDIAHFRHEDLLDACERIIRDAGEPIHIGELHTRLIEEDIPIPGKGTEANVISRLQRSDGRFIRTGRGMYALPEFGIREVRPTRQRRRTRKKRS